MLTYHLQLKMKKKRNVDIICEDKTFTTSVYRKLPLVEFMHILTAFYHLPSTIYHVSLVLYTHSLIEASEYAQFGLSYTLNYFF